MMSHDQCVDTETAERALMRATAEARCTHPDLWVSVQGDGTAQACWGCLLDAYFRPV